MDVSQVARDLADEQQSLDEIVGDLRDDQWALPTPSPGWTVADQIGHLAYFDHAAAVAITDPEAFQGLLAELAPLVSGTLEKFDDYTLQAYRPLAPDELLNAWRRQRVALEAAGATLENETRVDWFGPSMSSKSFLTARLMEAWAHGQDIVDALDIVRPATDRLRHIAQLGFITRAWPYISRGLEAPTAPVRLELTAPSGATWTFGPEDASEVASGPAVDFCLVVTQRRHLDDTDLEASPGAREWLLVAQIFAGPPTDGPATGSRP